MPFYKKFRNTVICFFLLCFFLSAAVPAAEIPYPPDSYEPDEGFETARPITVNDSAGQHHHFHAAGDADWVKFYGLSGKNYRIRTLNVEIRCNSVIEIYDTDGISLLKSRNYGIEGEDEILYWYCPKEGLYFVRITQAEPDIFGENTGYDLYADYPEGPVFDGNITGYVKDVFSALPVAGAIVRTGISQPALSGTDGAYAVIGHAAGDFTLTAEHPQYLSAQVPVSVKDSLTVRTDIFMTSSLCSKGDVNGDGSVELEDLRLAFHFFTGTRPPSAEEFCAANTAFEGSRDRYISLEDVKGVFDIFMGEK